MLRIPDLRLTGNILIEPQVYGWRRGQIYLYIGVTTKILGRLSNHHIIGVREKILKSDFIDIWTCPTYSVALQFEGELIQLLSPKYNFALKRLKLEKGQLRKHVEKIEKIEKIEKPNGENREDREYVGSLGRSLTNQEQDIVDNLRKSIGLK